MRIDARKIKPAKAFLRTRCFGWQKNLVRRYHTHPRRLKRRGKNLLCLETAKSDEACKRPSLPWQDMGLFIIDHLKPVFDKPEESVSTGQTVGSPARNEILFAQDRQSIQCAAQAQIRNFSTRHQLMGLNEKLDIPDCSHPELDIELLCIVLFIALRACNLLARCVYVVDRREIEEFSPDKRS